MAVLAATIGSVAGALILYALGRIGGRPLLLRHGRILRLDERRLDRADDWFDAHGPKLVLLGRLVPGVRSVVSVPAGLSEMPVGRFVALTALGSAVWNAVLIGAGWALGSRWRRRPTSSSASTCGSTSPSPRRSRSRSARTASGARARTPELPKSLDHLGVALLAGAARTSAPPHLLPPLPPPPPPYSPPQPPPVPPLPSPPYPSPPPPPPPTAG